MKIHNYGKFPGDFKYPYGDIDKIDKYFTDILENEGIDEIWYWYATASYEGCGQMIMRKGAFYDFMELDHDSSRSVIRHNSFEPRFASLDDIKAACSTELYKLVQPLVEMARQ